MIEITNLTKKYKEQTILNNVDLYLPYKGLFFLMGKNGSGKTTLIKCLLELEKYTGTITYQKKPFHFIRDDFFVIFDDVPLYNELTGFQNIKLMTENTSFYNESHILDLSLLSDKKLKERVNGYSLGEKKKLALIVAYLKKPTYLVIDEISNGLDVETLADLKVFLKKLSTDSLILATGHHFEFYDSIINDLLVLHDCVITHIKEKDRKDKNLYDTYRKYFSHDQT
ncbi:MAG: ATP-binding cassette domain-containing protein [Defluviitaleaceae bacterium]|nr:ATP-binding cassette domain-containing protein [Defluviitaleaceae bacterium]